MNSLGYQEQALSADPDRKRFKQIQLLTKHPNTVIAQLYWAKQKAGVAQTSHYPDKFQTDCLLWKA